MALLIVHHRVQDFDRWKTVFDEHGTNRKEHGCSRHWVYRSVEDPNDVVISTEWPSDEAARSFVADPSLREAMERAGVVGQPAMMWIGDEVESKEY